MLTSILIVEGLFYFFLQKFVKLMDEIINILDTSDECLPGIFLVNIRPSNVQKEFSVLAFFCVFSSLMMDCRNFVRSSVIKMLSSLLLRFFFFIKIQLFTFQLRNRHINCPLPLFIGPIMWQRLIPFSVRGCARPSLSFTILTISPSVCCPLKHFI